MAADDMQKVAVASLMLTMLLAGTAVQGARPIIAEGEAVAADGSVMAHDAHSRQLKTIWPWWRFHGCGWWNWWGCGPRFVPVPVDDDDVRVRLDNRGRRLNWLFKFPQFKYGYWPYQVWPGYFYNYRHRRQLKTGIFWDWAWTGHYGYRRFCWGLLWCRFW